MTRDEIQKLIGGYATGSLTEAERKLLFEAALEDQELFDALGREQALKELLELPGARQRLANALEPQEVAPKRAWWPWAATIAVVATGVMVAILLRTPDKQELASVQRTTPIEVAPQIAPQEIPPGAVPSRPVPPPARVPAVVTPPAVNQPEPVEERRKALAEPTATAPPPPPAVQAVAPAPPPPVAVDALKDEADLKARKEKEQVATAAERQDAAPVLKAESKTESADKEAPAGKIAQSKVAAPAAGGGRGGGRGGPAGAGGIAGFGANLAAARARFAFDYALGSDGSLRIVPASTGYLSVTTNTSPTPAILFPSRVVTPGTPVVIPVPTNALGLIVGFSQLPGGITGASAQRDQPSGTVEDSSGRILVTIPAKP